MLLFENSILKLNYDPATDILDVQYPDLYNFMIPEVKYTIDLLIEHIKNYDIKRVMLDASKSLMKSEDERSREISTYLAAGLMGTRIQRLARLQSLSQAVEAATQQNIKHVKESMPIHFDIQTFTDRAEAREWLTSSL